MSEKWKVIKLGFEYTNNVKIEVSDRGRIRTFTKIKKGNILNGALINGYRVISFKLFKPRTKKNQQRFDYLSNQISKLTRQITPVRAKLKAKKIKDKVYFNYKKQVAEADKLLSVMKENYRKEFSADEKQRTIYFNPLVHRLVAEYFCNKPSEKHNFVIHLDHNKLNNQAKNLKWATQAEVTKHQQTNTKYNKRKSKAKRAENSKAFKLNSTSVAILKKRITQGKSTRWLCKQFGISKMQLWRIKNGQNWGDIEPAR